MGKVVPAPIDTMNINYDTMNMDYQESQGLFTFKCTILIVHLSFLLLVKVILESKRREVPLLYYLINNVKFSHLATSC